MNLSAKQRQYFTNYTDLFYQAFDLNNKQMSINISIPSFSFLKHMNLEPKQSQYFTNYTIPFIKPHSNRITAYNSLTKYIKLIAKHFTNILIPAVSH